MLTKIIRVQAPKKKPGRIICIHGKNYMVYNDQPLLATKQKVIMHHLDKDLKPVMSEKDPTQQATTMYDLNVYNDQITAGATLIGYVD